MLVRTRNRQYSCPDVEVKQDHSTYLYIPLKSYEVIDECNQSVMLVLDWDDKPLGWIRIETLGYDCVEHWMRAVHWIDQGY